MKFEFAVAHIYVVPCAADYSGRPRPVYLWKDFAFGKEIE